MAEAAPGAARAPTPPRGSPASLPHPPRAPPARPSPTHRLHGRGHIVVALRLLGQAGSLQQLLSVPHGRFRGGCRAGHSAPLGGRERETGGGLRAAPRNALPGASRGVERGGDRSAAAASRPAARSLRLPLSDRWASPQPRRVGASRSRSGSRARAGRVPSQAAACEQPRSARLGASRCRCCRRLRLRAGKATRGRSRGGLQGRGGGRRLPRVLFLGDVTCYK